MPKGAADQIKELRLARWRRHHAKPAKVKPEGFMEGHQRRLTEKARLKADIHEAEISASTPPKALFDRDAYQREYMREYMRKRRAKKKEGK
jgi:hypothetical protein